MKRLMVLFALALCAGHAQAFCGFFVGKADTNLFNDASKVVMVRDGGRTTINMLNDYQGSLKELETHLIVSEKLAYLTAAQTARLLSQTDEPGRMLGALIRKLKSSSAASTPYTQPPTP